MVSLGGLSFSEERWRKSGSGERNGEGEGTRRKEEKETGKDGIYERRIKKEKNKKKTPSVVAAEVFS